MSASHTPGPWAVENPMEHELSIVEADKPTYEWKFIATVPYGGRNDGDFSRPTADANARLIAAAPDLLALARKYASECGQCGGSGENIHASGPAPEDEYSRPCEDCAGIRAVIDRAEGRS